MDGPKISLPTSLHDEVEFEEQDRADEYPRSQSSSGRSDQNEDEAVNQKSRSTQINLDVFLKTHGKGQSDTTTSAPKLDLPIVIPQRRPGNKERGFLKVYAPVLQQYGIDQSAWSDLLELFNKALTQKKWMVAIQMAAMGAGFDPSGIAMGVSIAVQVTAGMVAYAESKWRANSFLDRINNEFFRPRGLICLLMSYNPLPLQPQESLDDATIVSHSIPGPSAPSGFRAKVKRNLRNPVSATTEGEDNLPTTTAEVLPLTNENHVTTPSSPRGKVKNWSDRLNDYFDRRAQAKYAKESKNDVLSNPNHGTFSNRYLDPNSKASTGGLLGLLSGGLLTQDPEKMNAQLKEQYATQERMIRDQQQSTTALIQQQYAAMGLSPEEQASYLKQYQDAYDLQLNALHQQSEMIEKGQFNRRITRNILYLTVINMPSEEEMAAARERLNAGRTPDTTNSVQFECYEVE